MERGWLFHTATVIRLNLCSWIGDKTFILSYCDLTDEYTGQVRRSNIVSGKS